MWFYNVELAYYENNEAYVQFLVYSNKKENTLKNITLLEQVVKSLAFYLLSIFQSFRMSTINCLHLYY